MKITKEEKSLYNFLNIFYAIFGKSEYRNTIVGRGNRCYFFTNGYVGIFEDKDRDTMVGGNYDFGNCFYELKQTPSKTFVLDQISIDDGDFDLAIEKSIHLANNFKGCNNFKLEYEKDYEYKLAKIAEETGRWLKDTDIKYLDRFKKSEIFQLEDSVIIKSFGLTDEDCSNVTTVLVFVGEVHPSIDDSTQQKMNVEPHFIADDLIEDLVGSEFDKPIEEAEKSLIASVTQNIMEDDPFPDNEETMEDDTQDGVYF